MNHLIAYVTMKIIATVQVNTMMTPSHKSPSEPNDFTQMIYVCLQFHVTLLNCNKFHFTYYTLYIQDNLGFTIY